MDKRPIIAGHSHISAMGVPLSLSDEQNRLVELQSGDTRFAGFTGPWLPGGRKDNYWQDLAAVAAERTVLLFWMGNQHLAAFMFRRDPPIDFVFSDAVDDMLINDAYIVPESLVRERLSDGFAEFKGTIEILKNIPGVRIIICASPPPKENNDMMREFLSQFWEYWGKIAGTSVDKMVLADTSLMSKLWRLLQKMYYELAAEMNIEYLGPPPGVFTEMGTLKQEYWFHDSAHANEKYGALFLDNAWNVCNYGAA